MSDAATDGNASVRTLLRSYNPQPGIADELLDQTGALRPVWRDFITHLAGITGDDLAHRFARGDNHLADAGVFFRHYGETSTTDRAWPLSHIPVIVHDTEWQHITAGLTQRADLLEQVIADLYGPGRLVSEGHIPPQLVAGNREWLRAMVGAMPAGGHYLHFIAFEIGRSPDGSWFVLGDRTQAASGAGFALENRVATSRVFSDYLPAANVQRLAGFFRAFREALTDLRSDPDSRVAILTPGPHTDTYFEHAYIARYLGFMLLEGEDLIVQDNRVMVRTVSGPAPVDVLWRRLDSLFADPLELDEHSTLGTPGILGASRAGNLAMANALGSGVLEARALLAFLPQICKVLTGNPLILPNIATWWCGQPRELAHVRKNAERMMIGPALSTQLPFEVDASTVLGGRFRNQARDSISAWLDSEGPTLVGQEAVTLSTTPAWIDGALVPRPLSLRVFAARTATGWHIMPGGYARIGRTEDATALALQRGGSVADVWVVSDNPVPAPVAENAGAPFLRTLPGILPSRAADNLFWLGRYIERAEGLIRLLRAYHLRLAETNLMSDPRLTALSRHLGLLGIDPAHPVPDPLCDLLGFATGCAGKVRDRFSVDGWMAINDLSDTAAALQRTVRSGDDCARAMGVLLRKITGFTGLVHENMYRFTGWRFLNIGRALERADTITSVLIDFAALEAPEGSFDIAVEVADSIMSHRQRYSVSTKRNTVIDLLALDDRNPRAILYQLNEIRDQVAMLPNAVLNGQMSVVSRKVQRLQTDLAVLTPDEVTTDWLIGYRGALSDLAEALSTSYME